MDLKSLVSSITTSLSENTARKDVTRPLGWLSATLALLFFGLAITKAQTWVLIFAAALLAGSIFSFFVTNFYCLFTNPDLLQSEDHNIKKYAISQGLRGDDLAGVVTSSSPPLLLTSGHRLISEKRHADNFGSVADSSEKTNEEHNG